MQSGLRNGEGAPECGNDGSISIRNDRGRITVTNDADEGEVDRPWEDAPEIQIESQVGPSRDAQSTATATANPMRTISCMPDMYANFLKKHVLEYP